MHDDDPRPAIEISLDERETNAAAVAALAKNSTDLYQRGFALVRPRETPPSLLSGIERPVGTVIIAELEEPIVREELSACARFFELKQKKGKDGEDGEWVMKPCRVPGWCSKAVTLRKHWPGIRPLAGIVRAPCLRPDGTVLDTPGYDPATGLLYMPSGDFPPIPAKPSRAAALAAVAELYDVVKEFEWAEELHRAAWLSALLTVCARQAINGPVPLFLVDGNQSGAGKSKLSDAVGLITSGSPMARCSPSNDESEWRKRLTSIASAGDPTVLFDNVEGEFGDPSLDSIITSTTWRDRVLGGNTMGSWDVSTVFFVTGNNVRIKGDLIQRTIHVRLKSTHEDPGARTFEREDLDGWVAEHRGRLHAAAITILRAYCAAGWPITTDLPKHRFVAWSRLIRQAMAWLGLPDVALTRQGLAEGSDQQRDSQRAFIAGWEELQRMAFSGDSATVQEALNELASDETGKLFPIFRAALAQICPTKGNFLPTARALGTAMRTMKETVFGGKRLVQDGQRLSAGFAWRVESVG